MTTFYHATCKDGNKPRGTHHEHGEAILPLARAHDIFTATSIDHPEGVSTVIVFFKDGTSVSIYGPEEE